ncbi:hypothetical protein GN956_G24302 [Arapaima gigas]
MEKPLSCFKKCIHTLRSKAKTRSSCCERGNDTPQMPPDEGQLPHLGRGDAATGAGGKRRVLQGSWVRHPSCCVVPVSSTTVAFLSLERCAFQSKLR